MKKQVLGLSLGGIGHNLIYAMFSGYLLIFYTDVFGLSPEFTALLFLIARIFDTVNDPMMGAIADRSHSKRGKYTVWLLRAAPLIAASLCLCFFAPKLGKTLQYIYCYVTYILLAATFTMADIPYWSLPSVMTDDAAERNKLYGYASTAGALASGIGAVVVPMIVDSAKDFATGYLTCAIVFSVLGIAGYYACGLLVKEKVIEQREEKKSNVSLASLTKNKPLLILMVASVFGNFATQFKIAFNTYYGQYALGDYGYIMYLSAMLLIGMIIGSLVTPLLQNKFGSKKTMIMALVAGIVISTVYFFSGYQSLAVVLIFSCLCDIVVGSITVLVNSMTADTIDYAEYHVGERNEGLITSTRTFVSNLATALAGSAAAYILKLIGYVPNAEQTLAVKNYLHGFMSLLPAILYVIGLIVMIFYPLDEKKFEELQKNLKEKRAN